MSRGFKKWSWSLDVLGLVAEEIGLTFPKDARRVDLKWLIEESDVYKENYEFVKTVIEQFIWRKYLDAYFKNYVTNIICKVYLFGSIIQKPFLQFH
ncbi:UNVERIFIED_CONTAM: hypothetical protein NCL1_49392 [Trichonephila clavipes]